MFSSLIGRRRWNRRETITAAEIVAALRSLGIRNGDKVLVHSSLSKLGHVDGGVKSVIGALRDAVGADGTVMVPTLTASSKDGPDCPPCFDVRRSPSWTGTIPETLRLLPEAMRSMGPTHSVAAVGRDAEHLLGGHEDCQTPCGEGSPYVKLAEAGGKIVFLGVSLDSNTMFHSAEELAAVPYHLQPIPTRCRIVDQRGCEIQRECVLHLWGRPRKFGDMEEALQWKGILRSGLIGLARTLVVESGPMLDFTIGLLKREPWILTRLDGTGQRC